MGERNQYLYLRRTLDFTIGQYTTLSVAVGIMAVASQYITIPVMSEDLKFRDSVIVLLCMTGNILNSVTLALATAEWMVYLGACFAFLESTAWSMLRCMVSKCVRPDEVGALLCFMAICQAVIPIAASPLFGTIYRDTVESLPQTYFIVVAACYAVNWSILFYIDRGIKRSTGI